MWDKDEPETLSMAQWRERELKRERRSLIVFALLAIAFTAGLIYVRSTP